MKIMAAFSPLAFAVAQASTHENGLLFIQTQNNGSDNRYHAELADVGGDILNIISDHDLAIVRSEEHTSELQSLMRISYAVFCLKKYMSMIRLVPIAINFSVSYSASFTTTEHISYIHL